MTLDDTAVLGLFPDGTVRDEDGMMQGGGVRLDELAATYGTPALIVNETQIRNTARRYVRALTSHWPKGRVAFASKSFPCTAVYRIAAEEGLWVDVAGLGELHLALAAGVAGDRLLVHGNAKSDQEIEAYLRAGAGLIVLDNADDVERLVRIAPLVGRGADQPQPVLIRLIPGISPDTHAAMDTGRDSSKFGLPIDQAEALAERVRAAPALRLDGVHIHIGSQILAADPFARAPKALAALVAGTSLRGLPVVDLGGGLGSRYTLSDQPPTIEQYIGALAEGATGLFGPETIVMLEPGRSLVAAAGLSLYRVTTVKRTGKTFAAVDGGMGDNLEVSLYGQRFEVAPVSLPVAGVGRPLEVCDVVGRHCESGDRLVEDAVLPRPEVGDLLAVPVTGAYTFTMSNNYNGAQRPPVVFVGEGDHRLVVRRESLDDLGRRDVL